MKRSQQVSLKEAKTLARALAKELKGGEILALFGPLGAGKTTFVKTLAKHLGVKTTVTSPTFALMNCYPAKLKRPGQKPLPILLYHLDLYRTKNLREIKALGLKDFLGKKHALTAIEWADKMKGLLPKKAWHIKFSH